MRLRRIVPLVLLFVASVAGAADRLPDKEVAAGFVNLGRVHQIAFGLQYRLATVGDLNIGTTQHERAVALGVRDEEMIDPWGTPYRIEINDKHFRIVGAGSDRKFSPEEDNANGWTFSLAADAVNVDGKMTRHNYSYLAKMTENTPFGGLYDVPLFTSVASRDLAAQLASPVEARRFESNTEMPGIFMNADTIDVVQSAKTLAALQLLAARIDTYAKKHGSLVPLRNAAFVDLLRKEPWQFNDWLVDRDEWGTPFRLWIGEDVSSYRLSSAGSDREFDTGSDATAVDQIIENGAIAQQFDRAEYAKELRARGEARDAERQKATAGTAAPGTEAHPVYRVGGDVKAPVVVQRVDPVYPEELKKKGIGGLCIAEATIDETGHVTNVNILLAPNPDLGTSATDAIRQWVFKPATLNGRPVAVLFNLTVSFRLN